MQFCYGQSGFLEPAVANNGGLSTEVPAPGGIGFLRCFTAETESFRANSPVTDSNTLQVIGATAPVPAQRVTRIAKSDLFEDSGRQVV